jgi:hypothetical protein
VTGTYGGCELSIAIVHQGYKDRFDKRWSDGSEVWTMGGSEIVFEGKNASVQPAFHSHQTRKKIRWIVIVIQKYEPACAISAWKR